MNEVEVRRAIRKKLINEFDIYSGNNLRWTRSPYWLGQATVAQLFGHKPYIVGSYVLMCDWLRHGGLSICCQRCGVDFGTEPELYPGTADECKDDWDFWCEGRPLPTLTP